MRTPRNVGILKPWASCLRLLAIVTAVGCGSDGGLPDMVAIRGTVTYKGQPLTHGTVLYLPKDESGRQARGEIQRNGRFVLTTLRAGDGAQVGEYSIVVIALQAHPGEDRAAIEAAGGMIQRGYIIPEKYTKSDASGLSDSVDKKHSGKKDISLDG
jgi:hypothetical protein